MREYHVPQVSRTGRLLVGHNVTLKIKVIVSENAFAITPSGDRLVTLEGGRRMVGIPTKCRPLQIIASVHRHASALSSMVGAINL